MKNSFVIGTRGSKLALWQAELIHANLSIAHPQIEFRLEIIKTSGDKIQNVSLTEIGGRGVFTKELETALLWKKIDLAVHSLKDLPTILPPDLHIAAVLPREDARDAVCLRHDLEIENVTLETLPPNAVIGTSSSRRASQLKSLRPDVMMKDVRGNVDSRLRKLDAGDYDAILLAVAGLKRLGLDKRISAILSETEMLPQVGQGALAIETRKTDAEMNALVSVLHDQTTFACVTAERAFLRGLGGGCQFPIAAYAVVENEKMRLRGLVAAPDGSAILRGEETSEIENAAATGESLAQKLLANGAAELININPDAFAR